ncbi:MAG: SpoIID/LytB domain-containing protein [Pseudomonadota bacterium]
MTLPTREPLLNVALLEQQASVTLTLPDGFTDHTGAALSAGEWQFERDGEQVACRGTSTLRVPALEGQPARSGQSFSLSSRVGAAFHWSEAETLSFEGAVRIEPDATGLRVINRVPLETYLAAVVSSEMSATCPPALIRAHSVIARSWLLAQRRLQGKSAAPWQSNAEGLRWYDTSAHADFDVCAEDHCQRYHGTTRIGSSTVRDAVSATAGEILTFGDAVCDTRYGKCCGGIVEDARVAWSDEPVPYLVPLVDAPVGHTEPSDVSSESAFRRFLDQPSSAFCACEDDSVLDTILPERDRRTTPDFFRWVERIDHVELRSRVTDRLGRDLGRIIALKPGARGRSGRLWTLTIVGEKDSATVGKELEIRRVLSRSHLKSSAFTVDIEGAEAKPDAFVLRGAGWGHGAGLCQIGAAVMATRGYTYKDILAHYYPGTELTRVYE